MALARFEAQNKSASTQSDHQLTVVPGDGGGQGYRVGSGFLGTTPALLRPGGGPAAFTASHCTLINGDDHLGMGSRRIRCAVDRRASPCTTYLPLDLRARTQPLRQRVRRSSPRRNLRRPSIPPPRPPEARMSPSHASARSTRGPCAFSRRRGGEGVQPARSCAARVAQNEIFWRTLGQRQCPQSARHAAGVGWREREARRPVRGVRCPPRASHACRARPALASLLRQHVGASGWDDSIPSSLPHSIGCARRANGSCQRLNERPDEVATGAQGSWVVRSCPSWRPTSRRPALATHLQTLSDGPGRAASRRPSTTFTT